MSADVYVETSIVSYLSARTSSDVVVAAHQQLTRRWWRGRRNYDLVVSQIVLDEAAVGDPMARARRLKALRGIPILPLTEEATRLAGELVRRGALPKKAVVDSLHIAIAAAHQVVERFVAQRVCVLQLSARRRSYQQEFHMKHRDPIINELHKLREAIGKAHDFDVRRIAATILEHEQENREKAVLRRAKRPAGQKKAS